VHLSQPIGGANHFGQVTRQSVLAFAEDLGLNKPVADREIERLCKSIQQEAIYDTAVLVNSRANSADDYPIPIFYFRSQRQTGVRLAVN